MIRTTIAIVASTLSATFGQISSLAGNAGIGLETVKELAKRKATVVLGSRSVQRGQEAVQSLEKDLGCTPEQLVLSRLFPRLDSCMALSLIM